MATGIAVWAGLCVLVTAVLALASSRIGRLRATAWMVTIAALLLVEEDPGLLIMMASASPSADRDGVLGLVHAHTLAHMYGGAAWAIGAMFLSVLVAHRWLAAGDRGAWMALFGALVVGGAGDVFAFSIYPHGLPLLPTPADGYRGFGWPTLVAGLAIWAFALGFSYGPLFGRGSSRSRTWHRAATNTRPAPLRAPRNG